MRPPKLRLRPPPRQPSLKEGASATAEELLAFCNERLAPYKRPKLLEFRDELPKSMVGKILRRVLVEEELKKQQQDSAAA